MSLVKDEPSVVWAALAPLLAGQPRVRLSRDAGKSYPQKFERDLTDALPSLPAAVRIFGKDGSCRSLFFDFDSSKGGLSQVAADVRALQEWLHRLGARWIEDYSPNGGRHVYVPLATPATFSDARELVEALGNRLPSLDRTPHQNLIHGCMRVPGSRHKTGGHQQLAMSLSMAYDIVKRPNSGTVWKAMRQDLHEEIRATKAMRLELAPPVLDDAIELACEVTPATRMSQAMQAIARTGLYDTNRYGSNSEARQAVITGAAAAGLTATDIYRRMTQGIWPGLASFYARYSAGNRVTALQRDLDAARRYLKTTTTNGSNKQTNRKNPTSKPNTQPPALHGGSSQLVDSASQHRFIRVWRNAAFLMESTMGSSRADLARRMVLRAIGAAAHMTGGSVIEFGVRSLAVATGLDHTTVAAHLRALRSASQPLIALLEKAKGTRGDQYELVVPSSMKDSASEISWKKGKVHALRPVFRELGFPAAIVYEALEAATTSLSTADLVPITRLSRTAVSESLECLAAWNLAVRSPAGWRLVSVTSLSTLAESFGVLEDVARQVTMYREQRAQWRTWLSRRATEVFIPSPDDDYPWEAYEGPPDDLSLADLVFRLTG
ncbi:hypothetical protein IWX65_002869 [Arthrobacter sp. CAN_A214]|uniref:MarR family transcriptional regulator n=1 Tax=Arthrobacter sp. CAN_A214 TaxID=2787720 RepID=UPI001A1B918A